MLPCRTMISKFGQICYLVAASFTSGAASNTSCWSLTAGQCGPFTMAQCLIWTASHKTPGSATQCHLNQDWLELSLAFAFPPSSPPAFFPGRFMNNEWGYMQAGAQILMEQKKRRRTILCAASHCFPIPLLKLPGLFFHLPFSSRLLPVGPDEIMLGLSSFSLASRYFASLLAVTAGAKGGQWLWNESG